MNEEFSIISLAAPVPLVLEKGDIVTAAPAGLRGPNLFTRDRTPDLPAGTILGKGDCDNALVVVSRATIPAADPDAPMQAALTLRALTTTEFDAGANEFAARRPGITMAIIILSDKGAAGLREDKCAPIIRERTSSLDISHTQTFIIPDDPPRLKALLTTLALTERFDLILTSGGTGVAPRDTTPETTAAILDKRLPGYERAMTNASLAVTPHGAISRAVAGTLGNALIVNMPGSPKAVAENLDPLVPTITHTLKKLQGDPEDCARA